MIRLIEMSKIKQDLISIILTKLLLANPQCFSFLPTADQYTKYSFCLFDHPSKSILSIRCFIQGIWSSIKLTQEQTDYMKAMNCPINTISCKIKLPPILN